MQSFTLRLPPQPGPCEADQINNAERTVLFKLAQSCKSIVEIGTFLGGSAEALLEGLPLDGHLTCVDTFDGTAGSPTDNQKMRMKATGKNVTDNFVLDYATGRLSRFGDRVDFCIGESLSVVEQFEPASMDMVFLDAAHDYENVLADINAWLPIVKSDGVICGHDYDRFGLGCPVSLIEEYSDREFRAVAIESPELLKGHEELLVSMTQDGVEVCKGVNVHFGVLRAVTESFGQIGLDDNISSSIWMAKPEWRRV